MKTESNNNDNDLLKDAKKEEKNEDKKPQLIKIPLKLVLKNKLPELTEEDIQQSAKMYVVNFRNNFIVFLLKRNGIRVGGECFLIKKLIELGVQKK